MTIRTISRKLSPKDIDRLPLNEQLDLLRACDSRTKSRLLLHSDDGKVLMAALPAQEVFLMLKELGPEQLPELAALASAEQWTGFLDLDCWSGDHFHPDKARIWVAVLLQAAELEILDTLHTINFETLTLLLKSEVTIVAGPEVFDDEDARNEAIQRDGGYQLVFRDDEGGTLFGSLLEILFKNDPEYFRYVLEAVRSETFSLMEESVFQQRDLRLMDMGFPDPQSAKSVYARLDPESFHAEHSTKIQLGVTDLGIAPGFPVMLCAPPGLFATLLAEGVDESLAWELANLVNRVALADEIDLSDLEHIRETAQKVGDILNLAIEWLVGSDPEAGRQLLSGHYLQDLFRLGISLTMQLRQRANRLLQSPIGPFLDEPDRTCMSALGLVVPRFHEALEDPLSEETRPFCKVSDLLLASACLDRVEVQRLLVEEARLLHLPETEPKGEAEESYDDIDRPFLSELFLTALANRLLGRGFDSDPLDEADLVGLHEMVTRDGRVKTELREETRRWLEGLVSGGGVFGDFCLDIWDEEFCAVRPDDLDPRFLEGLLVKMT